MLELIPKVLRNEMARFVQGQYPEAEERADSEYSTMLVP